MANGKRRVMVAGQRRRMNTFPTGPSVAAGASDAGPSADSGQDKSAEPQILANCRSFGLTLAPFGAVLRPNERTGSSSMQLWEDQPDGEWLCVTQQGRPQILADHGENVLSAWSFFASTDTPMKLAGTWFYRGDLRSSIRAQALCCDLLLTDHAIRLGMSVGVLPKKGPWFMSDEKQKIVELTSDCVFAASLPYRDIELIDGGKRYLEVHAGIAALSLLGKIGFRDNGSIQRGSMDRFGSAVVAATTEWFRINGNAAQQSAAAEVAASDHVFEMTRRRGAKYRFT